MDQVNPEGVVAPVESVAPAVVPDGAAPEAVKPAEPAKPEGDEPKGVAKRIKELTEARRAAEAREERLWRLYEEQRRQTVEAPKTEAAKPKTLQDFNYDDNAYREHMYAEARKEAERAARDAGEKFKAEQEAINRRAKFDERVSAFAETVEDYHDVVTDSTPVSEGMADAILESEEAGALMYYLGNNPDIARKLYQLSPARAGREIQKIEDRLVAERKKAAEKPVSKAPPPAAQIDGSSASSGVVKVDTADSDALSDAEWTRRRNAQEQARRRRT